MATVLVVDDQILYRKIVSDILSGFDEVDQVITANNGSVALAKIEQHKPDIVTLDVEMPDIDGLEVLRRLKAAGRKTDVIMLSAFTEEGARSTVEALDLGAFDFIPKPSGADANQNIAELTTQLKSKLMSVLTSQRLRSVISGTVPIAVIKTPAPEPVAHKASPKAVIAKLELVAVGISTGGPEALNLMVPLLPATLRVPVVIVLHMPAMFTKAYSESLDKKSKLSVKEAYAGQILQPGTVYLAPGGKQMKLAKGTFGNEVKVEITDDPPENHCKPAVDYLFRSVADIYGNKALGVIMTGMGNDGTKGLARMKATGARTIAQNEKSCVVYGMPAEAVKAGVVDEQLPLDKLAERIDWLVSLK